MPKKTKRKSSKLRIYLLATVAVLLFGVLTLAYFISQPTSDQTRQTMSQAKKKGYDAYAKIAESDIEMRGYLWEVGLDQDSVPVIAQVHIDSIDGGRNYSLIDDRYTMAETYGKLTVLTVYKGDIKPNRQLSYSRSGGIVTKEAFQAALDVYSGNDQYYLHGSPPAAKKYVKEYVVDDIDVEVGKNYLAYMKPESSKDGKHHEYRIMGANFGFREVRGSGTDATILDWVTGKWESVSSVVKLTN